VPNNFPFNLARPAGQKGVAIRNRRPDSLSEKHIPRFGGSIWQAANPLPDGACPSITKTMHSMARQGLGLINIILKDW
jgi:hypothetical protein